MLLELQNDGGFGLKAMSAWAVTPRVREVLKVEKSMSCEPTLIHPQTRLVLTPIDDSLLWQDERDLYQHGVRSAARGADP